MKHAAAALDVLEPLLARIRGAPGLKEVSRGVFYRRSRAAVHFHEDPSGLYADARPDGAGDFVRIKVDEPEGQERLLALLRV